VKKTRELPPATGVFSRLSVIGTASKKDEVLDVWEMRNGLTCAAKLYILAINADVSCSFYIV
jgi:hypothetical protein